MRRELIIAGGEGFDERSLDFSFRESVTTNSRRLLCGLHLLVGWIAAVARSAARELLRASGKIFRTCIGLQFAALQFQGLGRVLVVKLVSTPGTTQPCNGGQPGSVVGLRHKDAVALLTCEGSTAPFNGSAYTV